MYIKNPIPVIISNVCNHFFEKGEQIIETIIMFIESYQNFGVVYFIEDRLERSTMVASKIRNQMINDND